MIPTTLDTASGSGSFPTEPKVLAQLEEVIEQSYKDAVGFFCEENKEALTGIFTPEEINTADDGVINYNTLYDLGHGRLAEMLSENEMEWLVSGGTFWYQFRVLYFAADNARNISGEDELLFMSGTNTDFEYGRDNGLEIAYEKNVMLSELTKEMIDTIITDMVAAI